VDFQQIRLKIVPKLGSAIWCSHSYLNSPKMNLALEFIVSGPTGNFKAFIQCFRKYSDHHFPLLLLRLNSSEKGHCHTHGTKPLSRPVTVAVASGCTFLLGEEEIDAIDADLES